MSPTTERPVAAHVTHAGSQLNTWQRDRIAARLKHAGSSGLTARSLATLNVWPIDTVESVVAGMLERGTIVALPSVDNAPTFYVLAE